MTAGNLVYGPGKILLGSLLGHQSPLVPVPLPGEKFSRHSAILAQSGAGKSFFLGRLLEELLLKTDCRVLVLDPNSDFVRMGEVDPLAWEDPVLRPWFHPDDSFKAFDEEWPSVSPAVFSNRTLEGRVFPLRILWSSLRPEEAAALLGVDPAEHPGEYWFLATAVALAWREEPSGFSFSKLEQVARRIAPVKQKGTQPKREWKALEPFENFSMLSTPEDIGRVRTKLELLRGWAVWGSDEKAEANGKATDLRRDLLPRFSGVGTDFRLAVIDLQSLLTSRERQLVSAIVLDALWSEARREQNNRLEEPEDTKERRIPTFVVIDEAHNLVPAGTAPDSVHEHIVRIAGEGRKYDLFLIVLTQDARKIDSNVLSQCENVCILRSSNDAALRHIEDTLGYPPVELARLASSFRIGDALLAGPFVEYPLLLHAFPRRTQQGGKSLSSAWARGRPTDV